jgi:hypothetical protein
LEAVGIAVTVGVFIVKLIAVGSVRSGGSAKLGGCWSSMGRTGQRTYDGGRRRRRKGQGALTEELGRGRLGGSLEGAGRRTLTGRSFIGWRSGAPEADLARRSRWAADARREAATVLGVQLQRS